MLILWYFTKSLYTDVCTCYHIIINIDQQRKQSQTQPLGKLFPDIVKITQQKHLHPAATIPKQQAPIQKMSVDFRDAVNRTSGWTKVTKFHKWDNTTAFILTRTIFFQDWHATNWPAKNQDLGNQVKQRRTVQCKTAQNHHSASPVAFMNSWSLPFTFIMPSFKWNFHLFLLRLI